MINRTLDFFKVRRRTFLINKGVQYTLLFSSMFNVFLFLIVVGAALFIPLFVELEKGSGSMELQQATAEMVLFLHANFWPPVLFSLILICLLSIRTSHRIVGPLYKITLAIESLKNGRLPKSVRGRDGDFLAPEIDVTNQMLDGLRSQVREIQAAQADLNDAIAQCQKIIGQASTEEINQSMNDIDEKANQLTNRISYFKVE